MKTGMNFSKLALAAAVVLSASALLAQGPGGGRRGGGFGGGAGMDPTFLLMAEPVQKELELTDDQKDKLQKFQQDTMADGMTFFQSLQGLSPEESQKKIAERAKETRKKLADILMAPQVSRLDEISIQFAGPGALSRDDVQEKLALTDDQKEKLKQLAADIQQKMADLRATFNGPPADDTERQDRQKKRDEITAGQKDKAMAILTEDQKVKFEKLQGKKFDITTIQFNMRGGPGGGRRGAGGPPGGGAAPGA
jgi:Spy/CpxP family protein refolding chaperone